MRWSGEPWVKLNAIPLSRGQTRVIGWVRLTQKHDVGWFWLLLHWEMGEDEPWYLVSDTPGKLKLIRLYKVRMWMEEMYGDMKGHGFDLEATHLADLDRLSKLVLAVCINFTWLMALGCWVVKNSHRHLLIERIVVIKAISASAGIGLNDVSSWSSVYSSFHTLFMKVIGDFFAIKCMGINLDR